MIASVTFRKFKALRAARVALTPFNLLIGPNGSGKTSLIQALLRLRSLAKLPLAAPKATKPDGPEIVFQFGPPHEAITARLACVSELTCDLLEVTPAGTPVWPALQAEISRVRAYLLDHYAMAVPSPRNDSLVLTSNGGNLAAVLAAMQVKEPVAFSILSAELMRILPEFTALSFVTLPDGTVELGLMLGDGEGRVAAENLSQGTLYLLAILTIVFSPARPALICIEEVDRGIHPRMLREVRDAFYRLSYPKSFKDDRPSVQVVATTHSPYLLDLFRDHPEEIVIAHKRAREAHFERLSERVDIAELLKEGSLGDMWFSGILGGVPERE